MWFKINEHHIEISVYAKPNAKNTQLLACTDTALHIALHAKPQEGEANKELISFIGKLLKVPKTQIELIKGKNSRHKLIQIPLSDSVLTFIKDIK